MRIQISGVHGAPPFTLCVQAAPSTCHNTSWVPTQFDDGAKEAFPGMVVFLSEDPVGQLNLEPSNILFPGETVGLSG